MQREMMGDQLDDGNADGNRDRKPGKGKNPQQLSALMECPVCLDISLPVYQCGNGHIICGSCWEALIAKICPTCRIPIVEPPRNRVLEQIIQNYDAELACKFAANGCPMKMIYSQREVHQSACPYRHYGCPLRSVGNCRWSGPLVDIVHHLRGRGRDCHSLPVLYGDSASFFFATDPEVDRESHLAIQIQSCLDTFFLIAFRTVYVEGAGENEGNVEYSALVQHVGLKEEAKQYAYRIELMRDGRRLSWEAIPIPMSGGLKSSMDRGDCLTFNYKTMLLFKNLDSDMLPVDVTINKI